MGEVLRLKRCKFQRSHSFATGLKGRVAWPSDDARGMKEPPAASHLAREADPMTASTLWAVQCGCADYAANIATIETTSPEEACVRAIEEANVSDSGKRLDDSGLTFVHALAPGDVNNPWSRETYGSVLPVTE